MSKLACGGPCPPETTTTTEPEQTTTTSTTIPEETTTTSTTRPWDTTTTTFPVTTTTVEVPPPNPQLPRTGGFEGGLFALGLGLVVVGSWIKRRFSGA